MTLLRSSPVRGIRPQAAAWGYDLTPLRGSRQDSTAGLQLHPAAGVFAASVKCCVACPKALQRHQAGTRHWKCAVLSLAETAGSSPRREPGVGSDNGKSFAEAAAAAKSVASADPNS